MNFINTMLCSLLMVAGFTSHQIQSSDIRDEQGRTSLINFVIQKEQDIALGKADLERLWNTYFYTQEFHDGYDHHRNSTVTPRYTYLPIRKIYTTDADVLDYREQEQHFYEMIDATVSSIEAMARFGIDINAKDTTGYTALNYCYTQEIYEALIHLGAHFQLQVWAYFNPRYATLGTLASVGGLGFVISCMPQVVKDNKIDVLKQ